MKRLIRPVARGTWVGGGALLAGCALGVGTALAADVTLTHQVRVLDAGGTPLNGPVEVAVALYPSEGAVADAWAETQTVALANGHGALVLGADPGNPLATAHLASAELWLAVTVAGQALPRERLHHVPRAAVAEGVPVVDSLGTCDVHHRGALAYDASTDSLMACFGASGWRHLTAKPNGSEEALATSCLTLHLDWPGLPTGPYWIDPDGGDSGNAFQTHCDMDLRFRNSFA